MPLNCAAGHLAAGTTEAAIKSFQANGFEAIVEQALEAAAKRSAELAEQLGK
jgi:pyrroline-5-carboxylate reductase